MGKDIKSRKDIEALINSFYDKVKADPVIGFIFNEVVRVNWQHHLPVMYDFWENMLLHTGSYTGNPIEIHQRLNQTVPLKRAYFQQWLHLFTSTVDDLFTGITAEMAKQRAFSISGVMQAKLSNLPDGSLQDGA